MTQNGTLKDWSFINNSGLTLPGDIGALTVLTKLEVTNQNLVGEGASVWVWGCEGVRV